MAISKVQAMRPALNDVIDAVNQMDDIEPYITAAVDEWLAEHPEATTTVQDNSITNAKLVNGSITDAKLVQTGGVLSDVDAILQALQTGNSIKDELNPVYQLGLVHNGNYDSPSPSTNTVYSQLFIKTQDTVNIDVANDYKAMLAFFTTDGTSAAATTAWLTGSNSVNVASREAFSIEIRKSDNSDITVGEVANVVDAYYILPVMPNTRKVINLTADSSQMLTITESCDINGNGHTIDVGTSADYALYISGNVTVNVYNLKCSGGVYSAARATYGATANFYNCEFTGSGAGLSTIRTANTNCWDCIAHDNTNDGFNYHGAGKHTAYNCYGIDNGDDGISNHEECSLKIVGGKWIGNAKAGIAAPTYGAGSTEILDVYCADNVQYGLLIYNASQTNELIVVQNAIIINSPVGARVAGYQCAFNNVKFSGCTTNKTITDGGTITEY